MRLPPVSPVQTILWPSSCHEPSHVVLSRTMALLHIWASLVTLISCLTAQACWYSFQVTQEMPRLRLGLLHRPCCCSAEVELQSQLQLALQQLLMRRHAWQLVLVSHVMQLARLTCLRCCLCEMSILLETESGVAVSAVYSHLPRSAVAWQPHAS